MLKSWCGNDVFVDVIAMRADVVGKFHDLDLDVMAINRCRRKIDRRELGE